MGGHGASVWEAVSEAVDPSLARPRLAEDIELRFEETADGDEFAIAANPRDMRYLRLARAEADVLGALDGTRSVAELAADQLGSGGSLGVTALIDLCAELGAKGFLVGTRIDVYESLDRRPTT